MDNQRKKVERRHRIGQRSDVFCRKSRSRNMSRDILLLKSDTCMDHSISSPSTKSISPNGSTTRRRVERNHVIKRMTSDSEEKQQIPSTAQTDSDRYFVNSSVPIKMSDTNIQHSFRPFLSIDGEESSTEHTEPEDTSLRAKTSNACMRYSYNSYLTHGDSSYLSKHTESEDTSLGAKTSDACMRYSYNSYLTHNSDSYLSTDDEPEDTSLGAKMSDACMRYSYNSSFTHDDSPLLPLPTPPPSPLPFIDTSPIPSDFIDTNSVSSVDDFFSFPDDLMMNTTDGVESGNDERLVSNNREKSVRRGKHFISIFI